MFRPASLRNRRYFLAFFRRAKAYSAKRARKASQARQGKGLSYLLLFFCAFPRWMLLKRGTGSGERGAGSGERGTEVWERVVSGNLHKNPKWRSKKRERERRRQRKEFVPWLKSGGDEIGNQTHILRLRFEQVVCFFDIQPVSFTI